MNPGTWADVERITLWLFYISPTPRYEDPINQILTPTDVQIRSALNIHSNRPIVGINTSNKKNASTFLLRESDMKLIGQRKTTLINMGEWTGCARGFITLDKSQLKDTLGKITLHPPPPVSNGKVGSTFK